MENLEIKKFFKNKRVFITGHNGFKGTWLTFWLESLGAKICGVSLVEKSEKKLFFETVVSKKVNSSFFNICNYKKLEKKINSFKPEIFFHLAAQPLVLESYKKPIKTIKSNVLGLNNVLEILRKCSTIKSIVIITSDKCYKENNSGIYNERSRLGGDDPYSASKAMQEILCESYKKSYFEKNKIGLATVRAGNIIGGCDFSKNRLVPDIFKSIYYYKKLSVRNPNHIRPWQFVADVTYFYILLSKKLFLNYDKYSTNFNLSPDLSNLSKKFTVKKILDLSKQIFPSFNYEVKNNHKFKESKKLLLKNNKLKKYFNFKNKFNIENSLKETFILYKIFYNDRKKLKNYIYKEIFKKY
jgi:CDP-glucose 4,6-dehydratase